MMKNKWHSINDLVLALIIILAVALIILWRFDILMKYPDKLAEGNAKREIAMENNKEQDDLANNSAIKMGTAFKNGKLRDDVNITILEGTDETAFKDIFDKKLFDNYDQFLDALNALNLTVDRVQTGTMGFSKGTSVETVLKDLTTT